MRQPTLLFLLIVLFLLAPIKGTHGQINVTQEIIATNVTLVWEAQTYTPPFYKGKALLTDGGDVKIYAIPPTTLGNPLELGYVWKKDGQVINDASGVGRNFFIHESSIFGGSPLIVVEVYQDNQKVAVGAVRVPLVKPRVLLYPTLPLAGILFGTGVGDVSGEEVTIEAYPLFFTATSKNDPALTYRWRVDGEYAPNPLGNVGRLTLRGETAGSVGLGLSIHNTRNILERADDTITVTFEE